MDLRTLLVFAAIVAGTFAALGRGAQGPAVDDRGGRFSGSFRRQAQHGTQIVQQLPMAQFGLHQAADASLVLRLAQGSMRYRDEAAAAIRALLGNHPLSVEPIVADGKFLQYTTDLQCLD